LLTVTGVQTCALPIWVSRSAVDNWKKAFDWDQRTLLRDQEIAKGVKEKLLPEWIDMKAYLLKTLIEQVKKARDAGIEPQSTRAIVAAVKEIRSMMGESDYYCWYDSSLGKV